MKLNNEQLRHILIGAAFFSTGGGGPLEEGLELIEDIDELEMLDLNEVTDSQICATAYLVGSIKAPTLNELKTMSGKVAIEKQSDLVLDAFNVLEENYPHKIDLIIPVELGGHNTAVSFYVAAQTGLPIINADLTGRSAPEMYQTGYYVGDIPPTPAGVYTPFGERFYIEAINDYERLDDVFRELVKLCYGYDIGVANFPLTISEAEPYMIKETLTICMEIGALLEQGKIEEAVKLAKGKIIFEGKAVEENFQVKEGFTFGSVQIEGEAGVLTLEYKNEILAAFLNDKMIAHVPELIGVVTAQGTPILNTKYKTGEKVVVFTTPAPEIWTKGKGLEVFGAKHFGY